MNPGSGQEGSSQRGRHPKDTAGRTLSISVHLSPFLHPQEVVQPHHTHHTQTVIDIDIHSPRRHTILHGINQALSVFRLRSLRRPRTLPP